MIDVDIAEFVERFMDIELKDWQKEHLRLLDETSRNADIRICMPRHAGRSHQMYIYMNAKELIANGSPNHNQQ